MKTSEPVTLVVIQAQAITTLYHVSQMRWYALDLGHSLFFPDFPFYVTLVHVNLCLICPQGLFLDSSSSFRCFLENCNLAFLFFRLTDKFQLFSRPNVRMGKKCDLSDFDRGMMPDWVV